MEVDLVIGIFSWLVVLTVLVGFERDDALLLCTLGFWYPIFFSYYDLLVVEYVVVVYYY